MAENVDTVVLRAGLILGEKRLASEPASWQDLETLGL